ncbi:MAG: 4Fe-4S dicluster domain-containing protein [bacterium]
MNDRTDSIRREARKLFEEGRVELILGFERGSIPLSATPAFITNPEGAERLIWGSACTVNLAKYLPPIYAPDPRAKRGEPRRVPKVGIVAKGCDGRAIVSLIKECQVPRDNIVIVGVPCGGMVDRKKVEEFLGGREIWEAQERDGRISLRGRGFEKEIEIERFLAKACEECEHRIPPVYDVLIDGVENPGPVRKPFASVLEFEAQPLDARWKYFKAEMEKCIRCYACRNACPLCYCKECFAEQNKPRWIGVTEEFTDTALFHIIRLFHVAGRCVSCGACAAACPVGVDLMTFTQKMAKDVKSLFDYEAGLSIDEPPPLATFRPDDPQEFITD